MTFESQYRFANISAMKARIGMKFKTYLYIIVKNYQLIFRKDPCTHGRIRGNSMRARYSSRQNACVRLLCVRVCTDLHEKLGKRSKKERNKLVEFSTKGSCQKHPEGGGPSNSWPKAAKPGPPLKILYRTCTPPKTDSNSQDPP